MNFKITTDDNQTAKRLTHCDDAFCLLSDISNKIRGYFKYEEGQNGARKPEELLEAIRQIITDEDLLKYWQ
jgi:hypothetical protein